MQIDKEIRYTQFFLIFKVFFFWGLLKKKDFTKSQFILSENICPQFFVKTALTT